MLDMPPLPSQMPEISEWVWNEKYRFKKPDGAPIDLTVSDTFQRVARAVAAAEPSPALQEHWGAKFFDVMNTMQFLPAGRIVAGAGTGRRVTLFNCFVMNTINDDLSSIFDNLKDAGMTMRQGGGIGHDFSTLRPKGAPVKSVGADASGPLSFMDQWDTMCRTIMSAGSRRGAMMATMRCDHPDVRDFIRAKRDAARLRNFNLSVLVTDAFMRAVKQDGPWDLVFGGRVYETLPACDLWDLIMRSTYEFADPGVIFIDTINGRNPLNYCETIAATNPCGEQPLPPYGACLLGSLNLTQFVMSPFLRGDVATFQRARLADVTRIATRLMDNVIDVSGYPLEAQEREARSKRRIGIGITGFANACVMLGLKYSEAAGFAHDITATIAAAAAEASVELGREKGSFPLFDADRYGVAARRNSHLTSIAPTGTISLLAGNVSGGIEPMFDLAYKRKVLLPDGSKREMDVVDYAYARRPKEMDFDESIWETAATLKPEHHLAIQAACQPNVDSSISKTINCPVSIPFEEFRDIYMRAYDLGLKGCTTYRPNAITGSILSSTSMEAPEPVETPKAALLEAAAELSLMDGVTVSALKSALAPATEAKQETKPQAAVQQQGNVAFLSKPLQRPSRLSGQTYKLKWVNAEHALYITINDVEVNGQMRPFEIFINTKSLEHAIWTTALTRMISAIFRKGGDVAFIVEELKAVFDPRGGQWIEQEFVPSLIAAIGQVIEKHLVSLRLIGDSEVKIERRFCPKCQTGHVERREGCWSCVQCDYSKCG